MLYLHTNQSVKTICWGFTVGSLPDYSSAESNDSLASAGNFTLSTRDTFIGQMWEWYRYSHLTLCKNANSHISPNVKLCLYRFLKCNCSSSPLSAFLPSGRATWRWPGESEADTPRRYCCPPPQTAQFLSDVSPLHRQRVKKWWHPLKTN